MNRRTLVVTVYPMSTENVPPLVACQTGQSDRLEDREAGH